MSEKLLSNKKRREESDARIINSAIKYFGKYGYSGASIAQIAKGAGVSPGLITNRYASKEDLFEAAFIVAFQYITVDFKRVADARSFLIATIDSVILSYRLNLDAFNFMSMLYISRDKPENFKIKSREEFKNTRSYLLLSAAQSAGILQKGDVVRLVDAFLAHAYIQVGICNRYGLELPSYDFFLSSILYHENHEDDYVNHQLVNALYKEYQSVWKVDLSDMTLENVVFDGDKIPINSVDIARQLNSYEDARLWYIDRYVVENSRAKITEQTKLDYILEHVADGNSLYIDYGRIINGKVNNNQICYDKIVNLKGEPEYIVMAFRDTDIVRQAEYDDLTGVLTRPAFFRRAKEMLGNNPDTQFDILLSDIVDFKKINETYGVVTADKILRWEGEHLLSVKSDDTIIGRYGGDQMAVLGPHESCIALLAEDNGKYFVEARRAAELPEIMIKFGIYENVPHDTSIIASCDKAHMALNSIKRHYEKETAYYNDSIRTKLEKQRRIEDSMYKSLRDGDFKVYYQPKHNARSGELVGAEALIRWIHPEYGFMNPGDFIPLFEQNGFIVENDKYVWLRTCENLKRWKESGLKTVPVSVNGSKLSMAKEDTLYVMKESIRANGLSPSEMHIEITETLMEDTSTEMIDRLNELREFGIKVELDDFGSGYSSLNVLSELPIDILKLDMSFMRSFGDRKRSMVLESCINLAKKLGFETVSEGVEKKEQQELLGELGVDMIQGYYYSRPLPEEEFEKYLKEHMKD